jgi:hypothetical protein
VIVLAPEDPEPFEPLQIGVIDLVERSFLLGPVRKSDQTSNPWRCAFQSSTGFNSLIAAGSERSSLTA